MHASSPSLTRSAGQFSFLRLARHFAIALSLLVALSATSRDAAAANSKHHVYLFRGLMNVFSLGMDEMGAELRKHGVEASVYNHLAWPIVVETLAEEYKAGKVKNIVLIGHSAGARAVNFAVNRLGELGVPVKLAIGLDPAYPATAHGQVALYMNYYYGNGVGKQVTRGKDFRGKLKNVNRADGTIFDHFVIDKDKAMQQTIIKLVRQSI